jgi:hypothetical protein
MTTASLSLRDALAADAGRRAKGGMASTPETAASGEQVASWDLRFRLVNTFPRQTRPLFASLRAALAPFGYTLSPLHPMHDLTHPRMQTELARAEPSDPARYAPLVFELEPHTTTVRVYVRQFGGRAAPDFAEHRFDLSASPDLAAVETILLDYIRVMLDAQPVAAK